MKGILNKRNAVLGSIVWAVGKRSLKKKAKAVVPAAVATTKKPRKSAVALLVAGAVGAATFLRSRSGGDETDA